MEKEDMFVAPFNTLEQGFADPQVAHNKMVQVIDSPIGPLKLLGPPYLLSETPATVRTPPPLHGAHTDEVLIENGFSHEEIAHLREVKAI